MAKGEGGAFIPPWVLHDDGLTPGQKILYGRLLALSQKHGYCYASDDYLSDDLGVSERTVQRWVKQLSDKGHIRRQHQPLPSGGQVRHIYPLNRAATDDGSAFPGRQSWRTEPPNLSSRAATDGDQGKERSSREKKGRTRPKNRKSTKPHVEGRPIDDPWWGTLAGRRLKAKLQREGEWPSE